MNNLTVKLKNGDVLTGPLEALEQAGVDADAINQALLEARIAVVKGECGRRIFAVASTHAQANMSAHANRLARKDSLTNADKAMLTAYDAGIDWIGAMQANVVALAKDLEADYLSDDAWPEIPAGVAEIAARF